MLLIWWRRSCTPLALVAILLAGCIGPSTAPETLEPVHGDEGILAIRGDAAPGDLANAPEWRTGQWWRWQVEDHYSDVLFFGDEQVPDESYEVVQVVVGQRDGRYILGMPADDWQEAPINHHFPAMCDIGMDDLSWDLHNTKFHPLRFPLQEGDSWTTSWWRNPVEMTVTDVEGQTATVRRGDTEDAFVYDATLGNFARIDLPGYATMEVVDHGLDFEGDVIACWEVDEVLVDGRCVGGLSVGPGGLDLAGFRFDATPATSWYLAGAYDRLAFVLQLGHGADAGPPMEIRMTAPDGTEYAAALGPQESGVLHVHNHGHADPGGVWEMVFLAPDYGCVIVEAMAYHAAEVSLHGTG